MRLIKRLESHAGSSPGAIAYREVGGIGRSLNYSDLWRCVSFLSARLQHRLTEGGVLMLCLPNRIEYPVAFLATLAAGCSVFPVSPESTASELTTFARSSRAQGIIGISRACDALNGDICFTMDIESVLGDDILSISAPKSPGDLLLCSSGTTNRPKIVLRDADSLDAVASATASAVGFTSHDRVLAIVPLCHSYGMEHGLLASLWAGSTVHLCDGFDLPTVMHELSQNQITLFPSVPSIYDMICQHAEPRGFPSLRKAYAAGAPLPASLAEAFAQKFNIRISQLYGATEIGSVTYANPGNPHFDSRSVGTAFEDVQIRIIDPTAQADLPAGAEGEVLIRARSMFRGYLDEPSSLTPDGFFATGDLGRLDPFGNLTITGRLKLLIDIAGQKVNVLELEDLLRSHPTVADAVVLAMPVSQTVSRLKAIITPADPNLPPDPEQLRQFLRQRVSAYKVPRLIEVRQTLPRSPAGKILRRALEEQA